MSTSRPWKRIVFGLDQAGRMGTAWSVLKALWSLLLAVATGKLAMVAHWPAVSILLSVLGAATAGVWLWNGFWWWRSRPTPAIASSAVPRVEVFVGRTALDRRYALEDVMAGSDVLWVAWLTGYNVFIAKTAASRYAKQIQRLILPDPSSSNLATLIEVEKIRTDIKHAIRQVADQAHTLEIPTKFYDGFWGIELTIGEPEGRKRAGWLHLAVHLPGVAEDRRTFLRIEENAAPAEFAEIVSAYKAMWLASRDRPEFPKVVPQLPASEASESHKAQIAALEMRVSGLMAEKKDAKAYWEQCHYGRPLNIFDVLAPDDVKDVRKKIDEMKTTLGLMVDPAKKMWNRVGERLREGGDNSFAYHVQRTVNDGLYDQFQIAQAALLEWLNDSTRDPRPLFVLTYKLYWELRSMIAQCVRIQHIVINQWPELAEWRDGAEQFNRDFRRLVGTKPQSEGIRLLRGVQDAIRGYHMSVKSNGLPEAPGFPLGPFGPDWA